MDPSTEEESQRPLTKSEKDNASSAEGSVAGGSKLGSATGPEVKSGGPSTASAQPEAPASSQAPATAIDLTQQPELDHPDAFGAAVSAAEADSRSGGGGSPPYINLPKIQERPYNPDESHDTTRQTITLWLIGLLCAIVVLTFVALFASGIANGFTAITFFTGLKTILDTIMGPVITLLASAVGFYFGSKQTDIKNQSQDARK